MKLYIGKHTGNLWDFEVKFNYDDDVETQRQKIKDTIADPSFQRKLFLLFKLKEGDVLGLYGKETDTGDYWKICDVEVHGKENAEIDSWNDLDDQKEELDEVVDWDEYYGEVSREKILDKMKTAKEARIRHRKLAQWGNVESRMRVNSLTRTIKHYEALLKKMDDEGLDKIRLYEDEQPIEEEVSKAAKFPHKDMYGKLLQVGDWVIWCLDNADERTTRRKIMKIEEWEDGDCQFKLSGFPVDCGWASADELAKLAKK